MNSSVPISILQAHRDRLFDADFKFGDRGGLRVATLEVRHETDIKAVFILLNQHGKAIGGHERILTCGE